MAERCSGGRPTRARRTAERSSARRAARADHRPRHPEGHRRPGVRTPPRSAGGGRGCVARRWRDYGSRSAARSGNDRGRCRNGLASAIPAGKRPEPRPLLPARPPESSVIGNRPHSRTGRRGPRRRPRLDERAAPRALHQGSPYSSPPSRPGPAPGGTRPTNKYDGPPVPDWRGRPELPRPSGRSIVPAPSFTRIGAYR